MEHADIPENSLICLRFEREFEWVLMTRWTPEIREAYEFAHSLPYTPQKGNREPVFPEAVFEFVAVADQTPTNLSRIYRGSEKSSTFRTKIQDYNILCLLTE